MASELSDELLGLSNELFAKLIKFFVDYNTVGEDEKPRMRPDAMIQGLVAKVLDAESRIAPSEMAEAHRQLKEAVAPPMGYYLHLMRLRRIEKDKGYIEIETGILKRG